MSHYLTKRAMLRSMAISQGIIALFIVINTFVPQDYHFYIMVLYFIVFSAIFTFTSMRRFKSADVKEISSGRRVLVVKKEEATELQMKDQKLVAELKPLLKASAFSLLSILVVFAWFFVIYPGVVAPSFGTAGGNVVARIASLLVLYEVAIALSYIIQVLSRRMIKKYVNILRSIEVYDTGIIGNPGFTLKFPVQGYLVRCNSARRFVEFAKSENGVEVSYRIYALDVERLAEIISRYGKVKVTKVL